MKICNLIELWATKHKKCHITNPHARLYSHAAYSAMCNRNPEVSTDDEPTPNFITNKQKFGNTLFYLVNFGSNIYPLCSILSIFRMHNYAIYLNHFNFLASNSSRYGKFKSCNFTLMTTLPKMQRLTPLTVSLRFKARDLAAYFQDICKHHFIHPPLNRCLPEMLYYNFQPFHFQTK